MIRWIARMCLPAAYRLGRLWWRISQPVTLGARMLVIQDDEILLVRLNYLDKWHLPGGGLDKGETLEQTATRELREETGLEAIAPRFFSIYYNRKEFKHDHVALYVSENVKGTLIGVPSIEIAERRFFKINQLPEDASEGTKRRIAEVFHAKEISPSW